MKKVIFLFLLIFWQKANADTIPVDEILMAHNYCREIVGVPKVHWSDTLAQFAQKWANTLAKTGQIHHSYNGIYGENIFWATYKAAWNQAIQSWCDEQKYYHGGPYKPEYKYEHYTQIIWQTTIYVGCGYAKTKGGTHIYVCEYYPPGNIIGKYPYNKKRKR